MQNIKGRPDHFHTITGTSGDFVCNSIGDILSQLQGLPLPTNGYYYSNTAMANILSLAIILEKFWVFLDYTMDNAFYMFDNRGKYICFHKCKQHKLCQIDIKPSKDDGINLSAVTVEDKEKEFLALECTRARLLCCLQHILVCSSDEVMWNVIKK